MKSCEVHSKRSSSHEDLCHFAQPFCIEVTTISMSSRLWRFQFLCSRSRLCTSPRHAKESLKNHPLSSFHFHVHAVYTYIYIYSVLSVCMRSTYKDAQFLAGGHPAARPAQAGGAVGRSASATDRGGDRPRS